MELLSYALFKKGATFLCNSKHFRAFFMLNEGLVGRHISNKG